MEEDDTNSTNSCASSSYEAVGYSMGATRNSTVALRNSSAASRKKLTYNVVIQCEDYRSEEAVLTNYSTPTEDIYKRSEPKTNIEYSAQLDDIHAKNKTVKDILHTKQEVFLVKPTKNSSDIEKVHNEKQSSANERISELKEDKVDDARDKNEGPLLKNGEILEGVDHTYKINRLLGEGNCSEVYCATMAGSGKSVAIKVFRRGTQYSRAAENEYNILHQLSQFPVESAITFIAAFMYKELSCFVFEQLDINIRQLIMKNRRRGLPLWIVQKFSKDVLLFLEHFHKLGYVHGDLKPGNIMWSGQHGIFKSFDFGLSVKHVTKDPADADAQMPRILHSSGYRAPEVIAIEKARSSRDTDLQSLTPPGPPCDIWAFGCLLIECVAGRKLLRTGEIVERDDSLSSHINRLISESNQYETEEALATLDKFKDLIYKCLAYDPAERMTANEALQHPALFDFVPVTKQDNILLISPVLKILVDKGIPPDTVLYKCASFGQILRTKSHADRTLYVQFERVKDAVKARNQLSCPGNIGRISVYDDIVMFGRLDTIEEGGNKVDSPSQTQGFSAEFFPLQLWDDI